jgi:hypothetical protein
MVRGMPPRVAARSVIRPKLPSTLPQGSGGRPNATGSSASPLSGSWGGQPPSRLALARLAYPGLIRKAARFNWWYKWIVGGLLVWLFFTCLLSWDISAGHLILARLEALETARAAVLNRIIAAKITNRLAAAEVTPAVASAGVSSAAAAGTTRNPSAWPLFVIRLCRPYLLLAAEKREDSNTRQFDEATELQLCDEFIESDDKVNVGREDIADWLAYWRWLKWPSHLICGGQGIARWI